MLTDNEYLSALEHWRTPGCISRTQPLFDRREIVLAPVRVLSCKAFSWLERIGLALQCGRPVDVMLKSARLTIWKLKELSVEARLAAPPAAAVDDEVAKVLAGLSFDAARLQKERGRALSLCTSQWQRDAINLGITELDGPWGAKLLSKLRTAGITYRFHETAESQFDADDCLCCAQNDSGITRTRRFFLFGPEIKPYTDVRSAYDFYLGRFQKIKKSSRKLQSLFPDFDPALGAVDLAATQHSFDIFAIKLCQQRESRDALESLKLSLKSFADKLRAAEALYPSLDDIEQVSVLEALGGGGSESEPDWL